MGASTSHHLPFLEKFGVLIPRGCNEESVIYDEVFCLARAYKTAFSYGSMRPTCRAGTRSLQYLEHISSVPSFTVLLDSQPCRAPFQQSSYSQFLHDIYPSSACFPEWTRSTPTDRHDATPREYSSRRYQAQSHISVSLQTHFLTPICSLPPSDRPHRR